MLKKNSDCPCCSGKKFGDCCCDYISGKGTPDTSEKLMRSRYTAYALRDSEYILKTWHPSTRPKNMDLSKADIIWEKLEIISSEKGGDSDIEGEVLFKAFYNHLGRKYCIQESSKFVKEKGIWLYLLGEQSKTIIIDD